MTNRPEHAVAMPRYQQIALELAARIACEDYAQGEKLYARSSLAGQYKVSPETARRAICLLSDLGIVSAERGSGVTVLSHKEAVRYVERFQTRRTFDTIKENLLDGVARQQADLQSLAHQLSELIDASQHLRSMNPFMPFKIEITDRCAYLGKSVADIRFWQQTGATIVAVDRQGVILKSPGPYVTLTEHDILYFLPQDDDSRQVRTFLYPAGQ